MRFWPLFSVKPSPPVSLAEVPSARHKTEKREAELARIKALTKQWIADEKEWLNLSNAEIAAQVRSSDMMICEKAKTEALARLMAPGTKPARSGILDSLEGSLELMNQGKIVIPGTDYEYEP